MTTAEKLYTREEFVALPRDVIQGCELIDGRIVKKHVWDGEEMGMTPEMLTHAAVVRLIWLALEGSAEKDRPIQVFAEAPFDVGSDRSRTRRPDLAVAAGNLPTEPEAVRALLPVMVVEVISPNNMTLGDWDKVEEYLAAGVQLVWLALPPHRTIVALRIDRATVLRSGDIITAEPALPGFSCPISDLFPPPSTGSAL
jgi:Uma2 family endonuclease